VLDFRCRAEATTGSISCATTSKIEKIAINLGSGDLENVGLPVSEGFCSKQWDLIRTAIGSRLARRGEAAGRLIARRHLDVGLHFCSHDDLEAAVRFGAKLRIHVLGLAASGADVTPEPARKASASIPALGALRASADVKAALADRMT
jgi:hypothetical protein